MLAWTIHRSENIHANSINWLNLPLNPPNLTSIGCSRPCRRDIGGRCPCGLAPPGERSKINSCITGFIYPLLTLGCVCSIFPIASSPRYFRFWSESSISTPNFWTHNCKHNLFVKFILSESIYSLRYIRSIYPETYNNPVEPSQTPTCILAVWSPGVLAETEMSTAITVLMHS